MGSERRKKPPGWMAGAAVTLACVGFATSVYLTNLYVEATEAMAGGGSVDSFCNISKGMNCETVAASEYSAFLGVPISVWGLEFFGLAAVLVLLAHFKVLPLKKWDSLLFALAASGVPVTIVLAWISVSIIKSVCIMCMLVYVVNTLMLLLFGVPNRNRLGAMLQEGPKELLGYVMDPKHRIAAIVVVLVALSQFYWVPRVMGREAHAASPQPPAATGAKPGIWLGQTVSRNTLGPENAPIRIEEFTDFQCPFCGRAHDVMLEVVKKHPGKIHLVHRDFPLDHNCNPGITEQFHPDACGAAFFARCAAEQDLYWPFEAMLFHNQRKLKKASMMSFAEQVGLDTTKMETCIKASTTHEAVLADISEGLKRRISGTPTFFVNGEAIEGARPVEFWDEKIQSLLANPSGSSSAPTGSAPTGSAPLPASASAPSPSSAAPPAKSH